MCWRGEKRPKGRATMENLSTDIMADILSRLPLKMLLRCRSVSKLWRSLISSHPAIPSRCGQGYSSGFFVFGIFWGYGTSGKYKMAFIHSLDEDMTSSYVDAGFTLSGVYQSDTSARPLSICNGLVFYSSRRGYSEDFYICNPETREHILIPELRIPDFRTEGIQCLISGLAFDPTVTDSNQCNIAAYKLVVAALKPRLQFKVYSSGTRAWTEPSLSCYPNPRCYRKLHSLPARSIFYHGVLHWLVDVDCLLTFDPKSETSRWVDTPSGWDCKIAPGYYRPARLVEWEGELFYVRMTINAGLDVWKMSDYSCCCSSANWVLLHSIKEFIPRVPEDLRLYPVAVDDGGDGVMFCTPSCTMIFYDLKSKRLVRSPIDHCPRSKLGYDERNGPWYMRYVPTTKFLTK